MNRPQALVIVSGGCAEVIADDRVDYHILDLDNFTAADSLEQFQEIMECEDYWPLLPKKIQERFEKLRGFQ